MSFFDRRKDLHRNGIAFSHGAINDAEPAKISPYINLFAIDRNNREAFALSEVIERGVNTGLKKYLQERPLFRECFPEQTLFKIKFSTNNVILQAKVLRNIIVTGLLAKKQPNQFIEFQLGFCIAMMSIQEEQNFTDRNIMNQLSGAN